MEQLHSAVYVAAALGLVILAAEKLAQTKYGKALGTALIAIIWGRCLQTLE